MVDENEEYRNEAIKAVNRGERITDPDADPEMLDASNCMHELIEGYNTDAYSTERYTAVEARLKELATYLQPGQEFFVSNKQDYSPEDRKIGYVCAGYGKSPEGTSWAEVAFVDHSYRGPLKG